MSLREPLFRFLVIGAVIFLIFELMREPEMATSSDVIRVTEQKAAELIRQFRKSLRREPTSEEVEAMILSYVNEEVLVREALSLSLDKGDAVVRQRLAKKMNFIVKSAAAAIPVDKATLQSFYEKNTSRYARGGAVSFEQVFLGPNGSREEIEAGLRDLNSGRAPEEVGRSTLLPFRIATVGEQKLNTMLGAAIYRTLTNMQPGVWGGPVKSSFGLHLVRILDVRHAQVPPLNQIRDRVEKDWRAGIEEKLAEAQIDQIRSRYTIMVPGEDSIKALSK